VKHLGPPLCLHTDDKLLEDIDDTVLSPPLRASFTGAALYGKGIQTIAMSGFNVYVRYTEVLKLCHMSLHVQYSVSIYM